MDDTRTIFHRYEEIRHRLPSAVTLPPSRKIGSLLDLVEEIDAFVFDAFGVLNVGETLIPGADQRVQELRAAGCMIRVLTNAASYAKPGAVAKFERLGIALHPDEIISSRDATLRALDDRHWGVIAAPADDLSDIPHRVTRLDRRAEEYDAVDGILFLSTVDWTDEKQSLLHSTLSHKSRPLIIANADLVAPREGAFTLEPGYYGHLIADQTDAHVRFFGKPFQDVYDLVQSSLHGVSHDKIAMCGDTLHTDILGAAAFGWRNVLVTRDGLFAGTDVEEYAIASQIHADWQVDRI